VKEMISKTILFLSIEFAVMSN